MTLNKIGIRREDKSKWERRVALTPDLVKRFIADKGNEFVVQPSDTRIYPDPIYQDSGAILRESLQDCEIVFAVKEVPINFLQSNKVFFFFSHTIKGQSYNMELLQTCLNRHITIVDYECIADDDCRRIVFFGKHAGYAGMIDSLAALGNRLEHEGHKGPLSRVKSTWQYDSLASARKEIAKLADGTAFLAANKPLIIGITGYGNVSQGAQSILESLPTEYIEPENLLDAEFISGLACDKVYAVVFKEQHMFCRLDGQEFILSNYFKNPQLFESCFQPYLSKLTMLVNCIYWTDACPRLVTKQWLKETWNSGLRDTLKVIGDISIDIEGSIECSLKATESDIPAYVYLPETGDIVDGVVGDGPVIMAVDNLPCEISKESSESFSEALEPFLENIVNADWQKDFAELDLHPYLKKAVITHKGSLMPAYQYLREYLINYEKDQ
jgi:saccharopine dehydrogenase (NAD+, L-lysine forming)